MPETAIAPSPTTSAPVTGGGESSAEPRITYGSPEGDASIQTSEGQEHLDEQLGDSTGTVEEGDEISDFGDADFGDDETNQPEKFTSEQYKALKQALAANPELFKAVKREISENSRYKQVHESPEAARAFSERVESLGGLDAIESESKEWSTVYDMFDTGDPGVLDYWGKNNPQAIAKLFPHVYDRMATENPAIWAHKAAGTFMATAQQQGMITALNALAVSDALKKSPQDAALVNQLIDSFNRLETISKQAPRQDLTPQAQALSEKEKNIADKERSLYNREVNARSESIVRKSALNELNRILKGRNLSAEAKRNLLDDLIGTKDNPLGGEYGKLLRKDPEFQKNAKSLLAARETEKFLKLVQSAVNRAMPRASRNVWRKYTGISGLSATESSQRRAEGQARRESGGGGTTLSVVKTPAPKPQDVDWQRMRAEFGRDGADEIFSFGKKGVNGGIRFYYKKGDGKTIYTF